MCADEEHVCVANVLLMCTDDEHDDVEVKDDKKVGVSLLVHAGAGGALISIHPSAPTHPPIPRQRRQTNTPKAY